jgi:hypothetical protein
MQQGCGRDGKRLLLPQLPTLAAGPLAVDHSEAVDVNTRVVASCPARTMIELRRHDG